MNLGNRENGLDIIFLNLQPCGQLVSLVTEISKRVLAHPTCVRVGLNDVAQYPNDSTSIPIVAGLFRRFQDPVEYLLPNRAPNDKEAV